MKDYETEPVYNMVIFSWNGGLSSLKLQDITLAQALRVAKIFGYTSKVWYKPKTWANKYTTYLHK